MEEMGGLVKRMPWTALFFLIGAAAISALPPLNGFVSEWLTYQSFLSGFAAAHGVARLLFPICAAMLALTGALAAACFVKAFAISFMAQPRSDHAVKAREVSPAMLVGMGVLAFLCVGLGLFPTAFARVFDPVTTQLTGFAIANGLGDAAFSLSGFDAGAETVSPLGIAVMGLALLPLPATLWWWFGRGAARRIGPTWDCGLLGLTPKMEYTATGFSKPLRMIFKGIFRPQRALTSAFEFSKYFATTIRFETRVEESFETRVYRPLQWLILAASRRMRALQAGSLQAYLIYIFVTLLILLIIAL
jgi:hydrogenase-4 component B